MFLFFLPVPSTRYRQKTFTLGEWERRAKLGSHHYKKNKVFGRKLCGCVLNINNGWTWPTNIAIYICLVTWTYKMGPCSENSLTWILRSRNPEKLEKWKNLGRIEMAFLGQIRSAWFCECFTGNCEGGAPIYDVRPQYFRHNFIYFTEPQHPSQRKCKRLWQSNKTIWNLRQQIWLLPTPWAVCCPSNHKNDLCSGVNILYMKQMQLAVHQVILTASASICKIFNAHFHPLSVVGILCKNNFMDQSALSG